ncbi:hypothetical protein [Alicyclobacillus mengziensis]|uniref:hypothetical protein n=1 Tax=Alicyclobacillus mengziensis TaxID=2931921 RepID=UPI00201154D2|nr:hypothetical protein [Alicyclobacillus mengziensis]
MQITGSSHGYVVGWGTLMLINANIAQCKNRSGLNWFFISLFIGPLATLLLAILDKPSAR